MKLLMLVEVVLAAVLVSACSSFSNKTYTGNANSEQDAINLESSKREYQTCIENREPGQPTCDSLKALYDADKKAYENSLKQ